MALGLRFRVTDLASGRTVERAFARVPVLVGRDVHLAGLVLAGDAHVSKLHLSVDLAAGRLRVRDVESRNGTLVRGARIPPAEWIDLGDARAEAELRIGHHVLLVQAVDVDAPAASAPMLGALLAEVMPETGTPAEAAALRAIQQLARCFGTRPPGTADEVTAFATRVRAVVEELLAGVMPLVSGLQSFERMVPTGLAAARAAAAPRDVARALFDARTGEGALVGLRETFIDLTVHQVALLNGMMRGVEAMLTERLSPGAVEATWRARSGALDRLLTALAGARGPWPTYAERHRDLADEENERFRLLFGREFAEEYRQFAAELRAEGEPRPPALTPAIPGAPR